MDRDGVCTSPLKVDELGYISSHVAFPLSDAERNNGGSGYTQSEWKNITRRNGTAMRFPMRDNHKNDVGRLLETDVSLDDAGRPILAFRGLCDTRNPAWEKVRRGDYKYASYRFDMHPVPGSKRYLNRFVEISLTDRPVKPEAVIQVACSQDYLEELIRMENASDDAKMADAPAATTTTTPTPTPSATQTNLATPEPPVVDMRTFIESTKSLNQQQLVEFSAKNYQDAQLARFKEEQSRAERQKLEEEAGAYRKLKQQQEEQRIKEQTEKLNRFAPLLGSVGMNVDDPSQKAVLEELSKSEHTTSLFAALAELAERDKKMQSELEEQRKEAVRAQTLLGFVDSRTPAQQQHQTGVKRLPEKSLASANTNHVALPPTTASLLGLDKFNPQAYRQASTAKSVQPLATPAQSQQQQQSQQTAAAVAAAEEEAALEAQPEVRLPDVETHPTDFYQGVYNILLHAPNTPIPVACSGEDSFATKILSPQETIFRKDTMNPWWKLFWLDNRHVVEKMVDKLPGYNPQMYTANGSQRVDGDMLSRGKMDDRQTQLWVPPF